jgi:hypothetical protein
VACSNKFQSFIGYAQAKLAMQRLGLLLAAVASLSGAQACQTFAGQCLGMISVGEGGQYHVSGDGGGATVWDVMSMVAKAVEKPAIAADCHARALPCYARQAP